MTTEPLTPIRAARSFSHYFAPCFDAALVGDWLAEARLTVRGVADPVAHFIDWMTTTKQNPETHPAALILEWVSQTGVRIVSALPTSEPIQTDWHGSITVWIEGDVMTTLYLEGDVLRQKMTPEPFLTPRSFEGWQAERAPLYFPELGMGAYAVFEGSVYSLSKIEED